MSQLSSGFTFILYEFDVNASCSHGKLFVEHIWIEMVNNNHHWLFSEHGWNIYANGKDTETKARTDQYNDVSRLLILWPIKGTISKLFNFFKPIDQNGRTKQLKIKHTFIISIIYSFILSYFIIKIILTHGKYYKLYKIYHALGKTVCRKDRMMQTSGSRTHGWPGVKRR